MSETKYTAGPWTIDGAYDEEWNCYHDAEGTSCAKQIYANGRVIAFAAYQTSRIWGTQRLDNELQANARLIAAAPELLDALQKCISLLEFLEPEVKGGYSPDGALFAAHAAIAKATGQA